RGQESGAERTAPRPGGQATPSRNQKQNRDHPGSDRGVGPGPHRGRSGANRPSTVLRTPLRPAGRGGIGRRHAVRPVQGTVRNNSALRPILPGDPPILRSRGGAGVRRVQKEMERRSPRANTGQRTPHAPGGPVPGGAAPLLGRRPAGQRGGVAHHTTNKTRDNQATTNEHADAAS
ncbi:unnamed protein product, partial [Amoebophrya sp. A120]